jgi:hypothetical protein
MTHTLHRQGAPENLGDDYVILAMSAKGINELGSAEKLREVLRIALRHEPVNAGDMKTGNILEKTPEEIIERVMDTSIVHAVFNDLSVVVHVLRELKSADLGVSVVVSGLFSGARECCQRAGLESAPHTVEYSLGVWGAKERLPDAQVTQLSTMCGHGMVSFNLVKHMVEEITAGHLTSEEAALQLAEPCVCGIFNPARAARLLREMACTERVSETRHV